MWTYLNLALSRLLSLVKESIPQGWYAEAAFGSLVDLGPGDGLGSPARARHPYDSEAVCKEDERWGLRCEGKALGGGGGEDWEERDFRVKG